MRALLSGFPPRLHALLHFGAFLALGAILPLGKTAIADESPRLGLLDALRALVDDPTIPPEWAGIWASVDSVFTCPGSFSDAEAFSDTLCTGDPAGPTEGEGSVTEVTCVGTVDAFSADITCTGTGSLSGCLAELTSELTATRSGDSYTATVVTSILLGSGVLQQHSGVSPADRHAWNTRSRRAAELPLGSRESK